MAHFVRLDENNVVVEVVVIANQDTADAYGVEKEYIGAAFCERLFGGRWVQTSYNGNFRKRYAGKGMTYREDLDAFVYPQPFPSWTLDPVTAEWKAPVPMPEIGMWRWNETTQQWEEDMAAKMGVFE